LDQGILASWQTAVQEAVINAYTRWMMIAGVDCRHKFWNFTDRLEPADREIVVSMNERHFTTSRLASTFTSSRKASIVIHRNDGSTMSLWPWVPHNAQPGEIDLRAAALVNVVCEFDECLPALVDGRPYPVLDGDSG
jgi:hypothetical protein